MLKLLIYNIVNRWLTWRRSDELRIEQLRRVLVEKP